MSTGNPGDPGDENDDGLEDKPPRASGGPSPFTEEEIAAVTGPGDPDELEDSETATIEADEAPDLHTSFDKLVQKSRNLSPERVRTVVESVLFVADKPLDLNQLYEATGIDREKIQEALNQISGIHRDGISGLVLYEVAGGWQFRTDPHSAEYVRRYLRVKPQRLTRAAVETLAIIAYRQPVTRPEVEDIRGVDCGAVIKALLDRKLIKILGKKEEVGRPMLYGTSREFLEFFALKDLSALPTLREFHELTQEHQEIVEKERPAVPGASGTVEALADPEFQKRMDKSVAASEAALAELEEAMNAADITQKAATNLLNPTPPPTEGEPGSEPA